MLNIFRLWQSFEVDAFSILKCTVYHNALQFCPIPWQFFRILLQKNSSNYREGNVPRNRLDCHFYCISWHVNSFAGFRKALLELNVNFRYQNLWKNTFVVKVTKFSSDSLDKNWNNIYYSWRQQAFIISNVSYFERQNLRKLMS